MEWTDASRSIPLSQRDRTFRKHHGWVRIKRCGFCERASHVDEVGICGMPFRTRVKQSADFGERNTRLTWYCCEQCAKHLDTSQVGWWRRAPHIPESFVWDAEPGWMRAVKREHRNDPKPKPMPTVSQPPEQSSPFEIAGPITSWADDCDVKFGSF